MVFYFYPRGHVEGKDDYMIYMGRDKYENEVRHAKTVPADRHRLWLWGLFAKRTRAYCR